jgi:hypothetical protein
VPAWPAGPGQVRWTPGQVLGSRRCWDTRATARSRPGCAQDLQVEAPPCLALPKICASWSRLDSALQRASFVPCHAVFSSLCFLSLSLLCSCFSPAPREGKEGCGGPAAFLLGAVGVVLSVLCGWLLLSCQN